MAIRLLIFLLSIALSAGSCASYENNLVPVSVGILTDDAPASSITLSGEPDGIAVHLFKDIVGDMPIKIQPVFFHDRRLAIEAIKSNTIQVLIGSFDEDPSLADDNIAATIPYLINELTITSLKKSISLFEISTLVFNSLFITVFLFSMSLGLLFTLMLYLLEKDKHPHFKHCSNTEKISYCFFTVFSCFFRDLLYDPVTSMGRLLFSVWMVVSVFTITILSALITSSVLFLMNTGSQTLYSVGDLRNHSVGHLFGYPRLETLLKKSGASTEKYSDITSLFAALRNGDVEYIALGRTSLDKYYQLHQKHESLMTTSDILLGYETWSLYVNKSYGSIVFEKPLRDTINKKISDYRNDFHLFELCSLYIDTPEQCVF